ncbi:MULTISPECIES: shikimate kinase [unclassified Streptomyces]|uniref:shikimate kinase n=1 Tax=unclassified Streptomyces TaxID=2593676 RepID=UPI00380ED8E9
MTSPVAVLIGPPGAGKSTVGELLAERLGVVYRDTDADIVAAAGRPIAEIFVDDGEPYFREIEREAVRAALESHDGVLSLGGGAILDAGTRTLLTGLPVVFLDVQLADAIKRVGLDAPRPLLAVNPRKRWRELMEHRRPLYTEVSRAVIATGERTPDEVVDAIVDALKPGQAAGDAPRAAHREEQA